LSDDRTSISVMQSTKRKLDSIGFKGDSYDTIIEWLFANSKKRKRADAHGLTIKGSN